MREGGMDRGIDKGEIERQERDEGENVGKERGGNH